MIRDNIRNRTFLRIICDANRSDMDIFSWNGIFSAFTGRWIVNEMAETNGRFFTKTNGERKSVFYSSPTEYNRYLNNLKSLLKNAAE